ncbi:MAG: hypothetical protein RLN82_03415, partial [Pseudomonadales bacterium]
MATAGFSVVRKKSTAFILSLALWPATVFPFEFAGNKWPGATTEFHVGIAGVSPSGIPYSTAFIEAMNQWNDETIFNFVLQDQLLDPCENDNQNSVDFTDNVCDNDFGANTLAVTIRRYGGEILGPARISEADIVVNEDIAFDVYDGPPSVIFGQQTKLDFRRIILHELGHVLGLDHENGPN